jgi:hypothetical protein
LDGKSQPVELAHIRRLPQITSFAALPTLVVPAVTTGPAGSTVFSSYELRGMNLEMIEKAGWDENVGVPVPGLPTPLPGQGQQQSLIVNLPDPPGSKAPLYIWLRGESVGRATTIFLAAASASRERAQNGRGLERPAAGANVFISSLAARSRALWASTELAQSGHAEAPVSDRFLHPFGGPTVCSLRFQKGGGLQDRFRFWRLPSNCSALAGESPAPQGQIAHCTGTCLVSRVGSGSDAQGCLLKWLNAGMDSA